MADEEILAIRMRAPTPEEESLHDWFTEQEKDPSKNLEEAAKQIIQLVSTLYTLVFGILAFADAPAYLSLPFVRWSGAVLVLAYLLALLSALFVVVPKRYNYARASITQRQNVYDQVMRHKGRWLRISLISFGVASIAWAALLISILFFGTSP